ncbi:YkvA family protein [Clostridium sp. DJ247]|uniref:YkvA family protein n=1 Tax=Clostridium sp. DJ247 TaxID=2726188 RepID=UPI001625970B|nr:YkvA family protein [Clostridium sp. DJ247]MBC2580196.1 DUF1232 domain-containing protein [Clostridium sp. DJ247]
MKVSAVKVLLNDEDILSIISDYIDIEGLQIDNIEINELITIKGSYKRKISIPFTVKIGLGSILGNVINIKIFNIHVSKIGILNSIKNLALKKLLKDFVDYGIKVDKDIVTANLDVISKFVPYFYFKLKSINVISGAIEVEAENLIYAENKLMPTRNKETKKIEPTKPKDEYTKFRKQIVDKVPNKYDKFIKYAMIIPDITALLWRLFRDKRVKVKVKIMVAGVVAYLASPIDVLPDFIPLVGKIDDLAIAFFALNAIINEVPEEIILENWQGDENIILITKEAVGYISQVVGAQNVNKLIKVTKNIFKKGEKDVNKHKVSEEVAASIDKTQV